MPPTPYRPHFNTARAVSPLPEFMPFGRFRGWRITSLPTYYVRLRLESGVKSPALRAALLAESGFRVLASDQREGR